MLEAINEYRSIVIFDIYTTNIKYKDRSGNRISILAVKEIFKPGRSSKLDSRGRG